MKSIKNSLEILHIKQMIDTNRFCLINCLLDADKETSNKINELDNDEIEQTVLYGIDNIIINEANKDLRTYRFLEYKLELDIWIKEDLYRVTNWFTYDKMEGIFEDAEVFADK